ncbi:hypothetical protein XJ32_00605 [Helicobacter bilis]|uniref:Uncharacterized protein n=1 Tax=Helicobacter bilis TaxID=37372 RepID=A0A1Q2LFH9_9HELI|nr:hypothetical protein XJ32_00605 [Helicobacter bilis]
MQNGSKIACYIECKQTSNIKSRQNLNSKINSNIFSLFTKARTSKELLPTLAKKMIEFRIPR